MERKIIATLLKQHSFFNLLSHVRPDGDSIGSLLAFGEALRNMGKTVRLFTADVIPQKYTFLKGSENIFASPEHWLEAGVSVVLDCSDLERTGEFQKVASCADVIINIDHHLTNCYFGTANLVDPKAAATGEIIFHLLKTMRLPLTLSMGKSLYVAISTDTGSFKFGNTTSVTHNVAAELLEKHNLNPGSISEKIFDLRPLQFYHLLKEVLGTLELHGDNKVAAMTASREMLEQAGALEEDLDGMVNYARNIEGVEVGIMFFIDNPIDIKVGFRSKNVDVSVLSAVLGGGGHARAAGCRIKKPYLQVRDKVLQEVLRAVDDLGNYNKELVP